MIECTTEHQKFLIWITTITWCMKEWPEWFVLNIAVSLVSKYSFVIAVGNQGQKTNFLGTNLNKFGVELPYTQKEQNEKTITTTYVQKTKIVPHGAAYPFSKLVNCLLLAVICLTSHTKSEMDGGASEPLMYHITFPSSTGSVMWSDRIELSRPSSTTSKRLPFWFKSLFQPPGLFRVLFLFFGLPSLGNSLHIDKITQSLFSLLFFSFGLASLLVVSTYRYDNAGFVRIQRAHNRSCLLRPLWGLFVAIEQCIRQHFHRKFLLLEVLS